MAERTTQIRPLGELEVQNNRWKILDSRINRRVSDFTDIGTFSMVDGLFRNLTHWMWAQKLLEYNPKQTNLSTEVQLLLVKDQEGRRLNLILPEYIRTVDGSSGMARVRESGYILTGRVYWFINSRKRMNASDLEKILIAAEGGRRPPDFSSETFVKVDPALYGQTLWVGIFAKELDRDAWDREAVVIDPQTRQMIEREVVRPLDKNLFASG